MGFHHVRDRKRGTGVGTLWRWIRDHLAAGWDWIMDWIAALSGRRWRQLLIGSVALVFGYYLIGMVIAHRIGDDMAFKPDVPVPPGGSEAVAVVVGLIDRELDKGWLANNPWFYASSLLDNTPAFQTGMFAALSRFSFELRDQIGRNRGSSASDRDLEEAAGNLSKEGTTWIVNFPSLIPRTPSESYYREARDQLVAYNARVAAGEAVFERRSDNLLNTLDRIALDLGASSAAIEDHMGKEAGGLLPDTRCDDIFYNTKGQIYAYLMILKALRKDFGEVMEQRDVDRIFDEMTASLASVVDLDPWVVSNGAPDGLIVPNHLAAQGFYLLRARTQLRELTNILLK